MSLSQSWNKHGVSCWQRVEIKISCNFFIYLLRQEVLSAAMPTPTLDKVYRHCTHNTYYKVGAIGDQVAVSRLFDGKSFLHTQAKFGIRFVEANPEELAEIAHAAARAIHGSITLAQLEASAREGGRSATATGLLHLLNSRAGESDSSDSARQKVKLKEFEGSALGQIVKPTEKDSLDRLILRPETIAELQAGVRQILLRAQLDEVWKLSEISPMKGRVILNLYGPPGCGKTRAALAVAQMLGKKLYQVDYAGVRSAFIGASGKNIKQMFAEAARHGAILFLDEADTLLSRRINESGSGGPGAGAAVAEHNASRATLMQELDRFDGVVICATNMVKNFDPAIMRRIARHISFPLPAAEQLAKLFRLHLPAPDRVGVEDWDDLAERAFEGQLSGGDVLNVCFNSMVNASQGDPTAWRLTEPALLAEVEAVILSKSHHSQTSHE